MDAPFSHSFFRIANALCGKEASRDSAAPGLGAPGHSAMIVHGRTGGPRRLASLRTKPRRSLGSIPSMAATPKPKLVSVPNRNWFGLTEKARLGLQPRRASLGSRFQQETIMETQRDPRGVPSGDGAGGRTPHSQRQLMLSANVQGGTFWFKVNGSERRAYVAFPQTDSPHAVVHTHADRKTPYKWESEQRFRDMIAPRLKPWYPSEDERKLLAKAENGDYDREAEKQGYDSPFSYVLDQMRERARSRDHEVMSS